MTEFSIEFTMSHDTLAAAIDTEIQSWSDDWGTAHDPPQDWYEHYVLQLRRRPDDEYLMFRASLIFEHIQRDLDELWDKPHWKGLAYRILSPQDRIIEQGVIGAPYTGD